MSNTDIITTAREYREIQAQIKTLEEQADALKQAMIREMDERQAEELTAGEYTIRWTIYESARVDTAALRNALPDVAAQYTKKTAATRFSVA